VHGDPRGPRPHSIEDTIAEFLESVIGVVLRIVWGIVRRPMLSVPLAGMAALSWWASPEQATGWAIFAAIGLLIWRLAHRRSFSWAIGRRARTGWRRLWVYELRWRAVMTMSGLAKRYRDAEAVPRLRKVVSTPWCDRVLIRLLVGQCTEDVERVAPELAHSFGARDCRVYEHRPGWLWLELPTRDPLTAVIPALPVPEHADPSGVAVGLREDGGPWTLRVLGTHLLIAGATGSGKGSVLWSLLRGLAPGIRDGWVAVWAIDPKGGMELGPGRALFARFCGEDFLAMADLLDEAVAVMQNRARRLAGVTRLHEPTPEEPLILVVVDEVATLSAYLPDRKLRERMANALGLLLTQGRAVGVSVIAALQDPRKEVLTLRNLFPARVALRLDEPGQSDMVLGDGARDRGARCDRIPDSLPGVGYVRLDGVREPSRVRAAYVSDADIAVMAEEYASTRAQAVAEKQAA
jgi:S-DNA-T family DNA segregation ATPase FtsK/SpoIIIE